MRETTSTDNSDYRLQCKLSGHTGAILTLQACKDGRFLASGGGMGVKVWDMQQLSELVVTVGTSDARGVTTKLQWIKREDDTSEALAYGTQNGYIVCCLLEDIGKASVRVHEVWSRQMNDSAEVTGLAFDPPTNRLAACHRGGVVQMFTLGARMAEIEKLSLTIPRCVPSAVAFGAMHSNERELLVCGLYCGIIYNIRGTTLCSEHDALRMGCRISDMTVDLTHGILCLSDPSTGVLLYRLNGGGELVKSFDVPVTKSRCIRQVALLDSNRAVVSGSDHGEVYVYTRRDSVLTKLTVDPNEWVQTITASEILGVPTVFAAKSSEVSGRNNIYVYRKTPVTANFMVQIGGILKWMGWFIVILAAIAFGVEKVFGNVKLYVR